MGGGSRSRSLASLIASGVADAAYSTFSPTAALNTNAATDSGDDFSPQVTTDGAGNWGSADGEEMVLIWSDAMRDAEGRSHTRN
jgi:hypothetical protein